MVLYIYNIFIMLSHGESTITNFAPIIDHIRDICHVTYKLVENQEEPFELRFKILYFILYLFQFRAYSSTDFLGCNAANSTIHKIYQFDISLVLP